MCVSNELCSEITMALLVARSRTDLEMSRLKEILIEVHDVIQQMAEVERKVGHRSMRRHEQYDGLDHTGH